MRNLRGTPVLIDTKNSPGKELSRIPLSEKVIQEGWLQDLVCRHPCLLPIEEIEPGLGIPIAIGREVNAGGGSIDNLYITTSGVLVIVECKLWRNRQQTREVLAQLLDYARVARNWRYAQIDQIANEFFKKQKISFSSLYQTVKQSNNDIPSENEYSDLVDRNISQGKMLLIVVGEGIREGLKEMADLVGKSPELLFRVALIEIGLYKMGQGDWPMIGVPTVVAETIELPRGVIHIKYAPEHKPEVTIEDVDNAPVANVAKRMTISESLFVEDIERFIKDKTISSDMAQATKACANVLKQEFESEWHKHKTVASLTSKHNGTVLFHLYSKGHLYPSFLTRFQKDSRTELKQKFQSIFGRAIYEGEGKGKSKDVISQAHSCKVLTDAKKQEAFTGFIQELKRELSKSETV